MSQIKSLFAPPVFEGDEEKTRRANLLNNALFFSIAFLVVLLSADTFGGKTPLLAIGQNVIIFVFAIVVFNLILLNLMRRGYVQSASVGTIGIGLLMVTTILIALGTIRSPITSLYVVYIIFAGLLIGWHGTAITVIASSLAIAGLIWAENAGLLPPPDYSVSASQWIAYTGLFIFAGSLSSLGLRSTHDALTRAEKEIIERKQSEAALRESEEKFRNVVEYATNGIVLTDERGIVVEWNPAQKSIFGVAREETLGQPLWDIQFRSAHPNRRTPEIYESLKKSYQEMLTSGEIPQHIREQESVFYRSDGIERVTHAVVFSIKTANGFRLAGISQDITERKQAEKTLGESELRFRHMSDTAPVLIWTSGTDALCDYVNKPWLDFTGRTLEQEMGNGRTEGIHPDDYQHCLDIYLSSFKAQREFTMEYRLCHVSGEYRWLLDTGIPRFTLDGDFIGYIGSCIDITERKRAEDQLRSLTQAVEQSASTIVITDKAGNIEYANLRFTEMTGYSVSEVMGKNLRILKSGDTSPEDYQQLWQTISAGKSWHGEFHNKKKNGVLYWELATISPILNGRQEITHFLAVKEDITERKQAEVALRESEEQFSTFMNQLPALIFLKDDQSRMLFTNVYMNNLMKSEDWVGHTAYEHLPLAVAEKIMSDDRRILEEGHPVTLEEAVPVATGEVRVFETHKFPIKRQGKPDLLGSVSLDITERKQAEERIRQLANELQSILETVTAGISHIKDRRIQWANTTHEKMFGYEIGEMRTMETSALYPDRASFEQFGKEAYSLLGKGKVFSTEREMRKKDGTLFWCGLTGKLLNVEKSEEGSIWMLQDISERKQMEDALLVAKEKAEASELAKSDLLEKLREAQHSAKIGSWDWNMVTNEVWWSDELYNIFDLSADTFTPSVESNAKYVHPEDNEPYHAEVNRVIQTKGELNYDLRIITATGKLKYCNSHAKLQFDSSDHPIRFYGTFSDVTERKLATIALQKAHDELEQRVIERTADLNQVNVELDHANMELKHANKLKDEFLSSMSHELRTPLTGILGMSESLQLKTYGELSEKQIKAVRNIEISGQHLLELINDILDLSKIEAGKFDIQSEKISVAEVCQASLQMTKEMSQKKQQQVRFAMTPTTIVMYADARRLKQMLVNLIGNAIKFTSDGGHLGLDVLGDEEAHTVKFIVWDKGIGIKPEDIQQLFKPFVQLDGKLSRQYNGTGLGLSLVKRMAELHGGSVEVESVFSEGSRFTIVLPWKTNSLTTKKSG